jgi:hypothetical protein
MPGSERTGERRIEQGAATMNHLGPFISEWLSRSGDFTVWGILITVVYAATVILSFRYVRKISGSEHRDERLLWTCILVFLAAMGVNKQLDLQILLAMTGRYIAEQQGWIEQNRTVQKFFAIGVVVCLSVAGGALFFKARRAIRQSLAALIGVGVLVFFTIIRVASINHIERAFSFQEKKITHIHGLELLGLVVIFAALAHRFRKPPEKGR